MFKSQSVYTTHPVWAGQCSSASVLLTEPQCVGLGLENHSYSHKAQRLGLHNCSFHIQRHSEPNQRPQKGVTNSYTRYPSATTQVYLHKKLSCHRQTTQHTCAVQWHGWPKNAPLHMCYHAEFGCSALKGVGINTGEPGTQLSWDGRHSDPKIYAPPPRITTSNLVVLQ